MLQVLNVSQEDIFYQLKISCQIPTLLEGIATRKIILDAANQAGIKAEKEELQQSADSLRLAHNLLKAEDTWAWLEKYHLSVDNFEEIAQINVISNKLAMHLFADKVEHFFYEHILDFTGAVTYEVILDDEDLAMELYDCVEEKEITFQDIVRQYIQNPDIRRAGGYQGIQRRTDFRPEIAAAVFAANPPQILKPISTQKGSHLIWVEEIIQPQLDQPLYVKILGDLFANWLKQQIAEIKILTQLNLDSNVQSKTEQSQSVDAA
ncbi:peptidylprolyl isomerase [Brasilonema sp. UFV-L1]|uniref:peptidylprolyl isomerase n=1 Tax=Brasilonema sp. UFV-L1 TaxID=2234130 RepID=UPI00145D85ED|nr:peptidylprolyl isomerase [Brasilonema sp. UFV-L1]